MAQKINSSLVIDTEEYKKLIQKAERLEIIKILVENVTVDIDTIRAILGVETICGYCRKESEE